MSNKMKWSAGLSICIALLLIVTGCGATSASRPPSEPEPRAEATTAPAQPQITVEIFPTATPAATDLVTPTGAVLPAPLYIRDEGQIFRVGMDGMTRRQITDEPPIIPGIMPVREFDISPIDGTIAYVLEGENNTPIALLDPAMQDARILLSIPYTTISTLLWSPDGETTAFWLEPSADEEATMTEGVYTVSAQGGEPQLLQASDPRPAAPDTSVDAFGYAPAAWSPDATRLLLSRFSLTERFCSLAIKDLTSDTLMLLETPEEGFTTSCGNYAWSADSSSLYVTLERVDGTPASSGLWQADAATGQVVPLVPIQSDDMLTVFFAPHRVGEVSESQLFSFVLTAPAISDANEPPDLTYRMVRINTTTGDYTTLGETRRQIRRALWSRDGSGAVVEQIDNNGVPGMVWLPTDGSPAVELTLSDNVVQNLRWGIIPE